MVSALRWTLAWPSVFKPGNLAAAIVLCFRVRDRTLTVQRLSPCCGQLCNSVLFSAILFNSALHHSGGCGGGDRSTSRHVMLQKLEINTGLMGCSGNGQARKSTLTENVWLYSKCKHPINLCFFQVPENEVDKAIELLNNLRVK